MQTFNNVSILRQTMVERCFLKIQCLENNVPLFAIVRRCHKVRDEGFAHRKEVTGIHAHPTEGEEK